MKHIGKLRAGTAFGRVAEQVVRRYYMHDVGRDSAALSYYLLFAIFPLLIFVSVLLGVLALDVDSTIAFLSEIIPPEVAGIARAYLEYVSGNASRQLLWFSLVFSIWFPMRATSCLMHSVRKAYGYGVPENIWRGQLRTLIFAVLLIVTIALSTLMITVGRRALQFISGYVTIPAGFISVWSYLRFILMGFVMALMLVTLYMLALGRRVPVDQVLPGVAASLCAWMLVSLAFSYYVENFAHYAELYGSIATIVVALLWLYWSGTVLIMGAELNGALIHDRELRQARRSGGDTGEEEH